MSKIRIFIIDDHALVRKGLRSVLEDAPEFSVVGEAASLADAQKLMSTAIPDIVLLDISLPDGSGFVFLQYWRAINENLKVVMLTMHKEGPYIRRARELGASGYVVKDMAPEHLISALKSVHENGEFFCREDENSAGTNQPEERVKLSPREERVWLLLTEGKSLTDIAKLMDISVKTVFTYRSRILQKLNLKTTEDLVRFGQKDL